MKGLLFSDPFKNGAYWKGVGGSFSIYTYICIYNVLLEKAFFNIFISFPDLPSQSSFVQGDFKCSFKSLQSSFENHNSCRCY